MDQQPLPDPLTQATAPKQLHSRRILAQVTPEAEERRRLSKLRFPMLRLSPGEYVIEEVTRHPIGLVSIWAVAGFIILLFLGIVPMYAMNQAFISQLFLVPLDNLPSAATITTPILILVGFVVLGGVIATIVYRGNRFYLTNESVIQHLQYSLFNTKQQVANLINVEDASSTQDNIIQQLLNYGTLRLSTQGEETVYHFRFVYNPKKVVNDVNEAMENAVRQLEGANFPPTEY